MRISLRGLWSWPFGFALLFFPIPLLLFHFYPISFWASTDYLPLGLANALNMAYRIADRQMYPAVGMMDHPGVPFYFMSWLALAFTGYPVATRGPGFFHAVVEHADDYYRYAMLLGALIGAAGVYLFARSARNLAPGPVVAVGLLAWLVSTPATLQVFVSPGIDLFAILLDGLFFAVLVRLACMPDVTAKITMLSACVSASAYLTKLSYINFSLALSAAGIADLYFRGIGWKRGKQLSVLFTLVSLGVISAVGVFLISWEGFVRLLRFHKNIFFHSGSYGSGDHIVASTDEIWRALAMIPADRAYAVFIALFAGTGLILGGLHAARKSAQHRPAAVISIGSGIASALSALFVIKHYDLHYTAAVSATLPSSVVAAYLLAKSLNYRFGLAEPVLAALAIIFMTIGTMPSLVASLGQSSVTTELARSDLSEIITRTRGIDGAVEFSYKVPLPGYGEGFLIYYASVPRLKAEYVESQPRMFGDTAAAWIDRDPAAYVLDKRYFTTADEIKASPNIIPLNRKPVTFKAGDELIELHTVFLLIPHTAS